MSIRAFPDPVDGLSIERRDGVVAITLDRADRRNAVTDAMVLALIDTIEVAGSDAEVRVIALRGAGDHFCSGFDLSLRGGNDERPRTGSTQRQMRWHVNRLIPTMLETQTPIVCAAQGWCVGLGLHLVLASDFAVVADDARMWAPFVSMGFTPDSGGSWLIPRLAGVARAREILMLARRFTGAEAGEWGLVHRAVPPAEVDTRAAALIAELAAAPTVAVGLTKTLISAGLQRSFDDHLDHESLALELASRSDDFHEATRARREDRPPDFTGR